MQVPTQKLKPLASVELSADEKKLLAWLKTAKWEAVDEKSSKVKAPEFFGGVRLYNMQGGAGASGAHGAISLLIKKLEYQGVISKQDLYPLASTTAGRYLTLKKTDLENIGVGT